MNFLISSAHAQAAGGPQPGQADWGMLIMMVGLFIFFYFIAIRPQRKRQKEHEKLVSELAKGDEVVTASGILGRITGLDDNYVVLNVANNVDMKFQRLQVHARLPKGTLKSIG